MSAALDSFSPAIRTWFADTFGTLTAPQEMGWPAIQRGDHALILSPTGSGKTLAAFLWGIDQLYRERRAVEEGHKPDVRGVRLLYVSPLKALNNDVERNLRAPLAGVRRVAREQGAPLPRLNVMVRTGDTPQSVRRRMVKNPPHILITTPESLYLILTSPVAREMFRSVKTVIIDEIHTLVGNKRGVHLALSLERVVELAGGPVQRIGLSATQRPLDEVARFLGGYESSASRGPVRARTEELVPRPVTIVDAGLVKSMDVRVVTAVDDFGGLPGGSIWPAIMPRVMDLIEAHHTTLVFANSRRQAERAADRLNELWLSRKAGHEGGPEAMAKDGVPSALGIQGTGTVGGPFRAHHGSISREARLRLEQELKEGKLPALVGTASLELGIDIGSIDLVVQLQSPKGVARGLQRTGRSGHLVGQTSVGRFFATHREDLLETAAIVHSMREGDVEPSYTPQNCLDVLAQQIVAMVSVQDWEASDLLALVRRAYPYHRLTVGLLHSVLDMLSGRYPSSAFRELRPRIAWDRVHDRLAALPGSRLLAIRNGGTIPDRGTFAAYLPDRKTRLGELDEEFVFETRPGDVFTLGSSTWRVQEVTEDRLIVAPAPGYLPRMPFWRGDLPRRDYHLGRIVGRFRRELSERIVDSDVDPIGWLQQHYNLDLNSARNAATYVQRQVEVLGAISSDRTVIAELFTDQLGDLRLVIHSCFGSRVNSPWALALAQGFREALGSQPEVLVSDDGILFRFLEADRDPPLELIRQMGPEEVRERLLVELPNSAVFGAQFRMNAARALLLPAARGSQKRTPFWLQRLRAKDLLSVAKGFEDFPIIAETYRDCLRDVLDMAHLQEVLRDIHKGEIRLITVETVVPSPVAAGLLYDMISRYMYEWDQPKAEQQMQTLLLGREMLSQLLDEAALPDLLQPEAVRDVSAHLQRLADGTRARTPDELATVFLALGDLTAQEAAARSDGDGLAWIDQLAAEGRLVRLDMPSGQRYTLAEHARSYHLAFSATGPEEDIDDARRTLLRRFLSTSGPLSHAALRARYPWPVDWLDGALEALIDSGEIVAGHISPPPATETADSGPPVREYCDRRNLERIHRTTLALLRRAVKPVSIYAYADFLARWQHLHPVERMAGHGSLVRLLQELRGVPAPGIVWERDLLPLRLQGFDSQELDELCARGDLVWVAAGGKDPRRARVRFLFRGEGSLFLSPEQPDDELSSDSLRVLDFLRVEGACFLADLEAGTTLAGPELGAALVDLVLSGLVTNDTFQALRQVVAWGAEGAGESERAPLSSLELELAAWRRARPSSGRQMAARGGTAFRGREGMRQPPSRPRLHSARRAVAQRLGRASTPSWPGRWSLVHRIGVWGREVSFEERAERQARQILQCYGIVTRQTLERDPEGGWDWGILYRQLQLMEMRGEVRRGYFVQGLPGVQFALPEAVERLRQWTHPDAPGAQELILLNATDPANLFGPAIDAEGIDAYGVQTSGTGAPEPARFSRIPSNYVVLLRGRPILLLEIGAERVTSLPDLPQTTVQQALALAVAHIGPCQRRLSVGDWNGVPVLDSPLAPLLEPVGFRREALVYVLDPPGGWEPPGN